MEVLNDLGYFKNVKIYQETDWFSYSIDSILLANLVKPKKNEIILDLCTGNAIVPLYVSNLYNNQIYGIELQKQVYDLALKSITFNNLHNQIKLYNDDIENIKKYFKHESIDIITCNPPYFKKSDRNKYNVNDIKSIARHEIKFNLETMCRSINYVMKNTGTFYMVHRPFRLDEIILILSKYNLTVKEVRFCHPRIGDNSNMMLLKIKKTNNKEMKILNPLVLHSNKNNEYSEEVIKILGGNL